MTFFFFFEIRKYYYRIMKSQRLEAKWMDNGDKPISLVRER